MCGIVGIVQKDKQVEKEQCSNAAKTLHKRGPDQAGVYVGGKIGLGHQRLSIIDLSDKGRQPMFNEKGTVGIVFNGEIYNYKEIKQRLGDKYNWKSKTDTEVLLHAYEEWGYDMVEEIEGMFAFAIFDNVREEVFFVRDHFGKKPLYYYLDDDVFMLASEVKAILKNEHIKSKLKIDDASLMKYLFYGYVPSPGSIFKQIKKVEPSTACVFDKTLWKMIHTYKYWNLNEIKINHGLSEGEVLKHSEELIVKAVEKRLMSDVPLGVFLSGGVDSSLVAALLSRSNPDTNAFTVCYKDADEADESKYARQVAKHLGIKYNLCYFQDTDVKTHFLEMLNYLDEPMADAAIIPLYFIAKQAKNKITVALSGDGGDELFGGYPKHTAQEFIEAHKYLSFIARLAGGLMPKKHPYYKLMKGFNEPFAARQFMFGSGGFMKNEARKIVGDSVINKDALDASSIFEDALGQCAKFEQPDVLNKSLFLDCAIQLPDWYLVKGDRATMAASLEMRNPLLDKDLAEFMFSVPGEMKTKGGESKYLLKKIASKYVPHDVIYRQKRGFGVPLHKWIRHDLKDLMHDYLSQKNDYFNQKQVQKLFSDHLKGKADNSFKILRIFNFNYFLQTWVN
ncbi:asparagine synthase (glutamine-hydrolyzing) [Patescibacteria group bacterium]